MAKSPCGCLLVWQTPLNCTKKKEKEKKVVMWKLATWPMYPTTRQKRGNKLLALNYGWVYGLVGE